MNGVLQTLASVFSRLWVSASDVLQGFASWGTSTWLLAVIGLLIAVILYLLKQSRPSSAPQILVSKGEVKQPSNSTTQALTVKISNLNEYPIQLLEITLKTELMTHALMIEAVELLGPHETVELEASLPNNIVGDAGVMHVYTYLAKYKRLYRLHAAMDWEPWVGRYKVSPLGQRLKRSQKLESARTRQLRKRAWYERHAKPVIPEQNLAEPQREPFPAEKQQALAKADDLPKRPQPIKPQPHLETPQTPLAKKPAQARTFPKEF